MWLRENVFIVANENVGLSKEKEMRIHIDNYMYLMYF